MCPALESDFATALSSHELQGRLAHQFGPSVSLYVLCLLGLDRAENPPETHIDATQISRAFELALELSRNPTAFAEAGVRCTLQRVCERWERPRPRSAIQNFFRRRLSVLLEARDTPASEHSSDSETFSSDESGNPTSLRPVTLLEEDLAWNIGRMIAVSLADHFNESAAADHAATFAAESVALALLE